MATFPLEKKLLTVSGNTIQIPKARNYLLTVNEKSLEHYEEIKEYLTGFKSCSYYLCCEHIGQENKHYHIYIQFTSPIRINLQKTFGTHVEKAYGTPQQNYNYVKALDEKHVKLGITSVLIDEFGNIRLSGGRTIKDVKAMSKEEREDLPIQYYNIVNKINDEEDSDLSIDNISKKVEIYYISGPSGVGKTQLAMSMIKERYKTVNQIKYENGFYHGVNAHSKAKAAIYDDFRDSHMHPSEFINLVDYNKHYMNIKGGSKLNEYEFIVITSVQRLASIYRNMHDQEPREQWLRRIIEIRLPISDGDSDSENSEDENLDIVV